MEGIVMIVSFIAGIACAFLVGVRIGMDKGYAKGMKEAADALMEIHHQSEAAIKEELKEINRMKRIQEEEKI